MQYFVQLLYAPLPFNLHYANIMKLQIFRPQFFRPSRLKVKLLFI